MQPPLSVPGISCGINHWKSYYVEKKEMKYCLGFATTELAAQDPPDLPDSIFLMSPKGKQDQECFLKCLFQGP